MQKITPFLWFDKKAGEAGAVPVDLRVSRSGLQRA